MFAQISMKNTKDISNFKLASVLGFTVDRREVLVDPLNTILDFNSPQVHDYLFKNLKKLPEKFEKPIVDGGSRCTFSVYMIDST